MKMLSWCALKALCVSHAERLASLVGHNVRAMEDSDVANRRKAVRHELHLGRRKPQCDVLSNNIAMDGRNSRQDTMLRGRSQTSSDVHHSGFSLCTASVTASVWHAAAEKTLALV